MAYPDAIGGGTLTDMASGNLQNYMPIVWAKKVLAATENELVCWKCIDTSWQSELSNGGDTIVINPLLNITATAVNTDADPTGYDTDQGAPTNLIINYWYEAVVGVNDAQRLMGVPDYEKRVIPKLGYAIAKQIDTNVNALFSSFSQAVGAEGVPVTFDTLLEAKAYLDLADAPESDRFLIIDPETLTDLMKDDTFTSTLYGGGGAVQKGWVGQSKVLNCTVLMTNNLEVINTNYHGACMMHREALAGAMRQDMKLTTWREERRHTTFHRASSMYGVIEVRDTFGVWIRTRS